MRKLCLTILLLLAFALCGCEDRSEKGEVKEAEAPEELTPYSWELSGLVDAPNGWDPRWMYGDTNLFTVYVERSQPPGYPPDGYRYWDILWVHPSYLTWHLLFTSPDGCRWAFNTTVPFAPPPDSYSYHGPCWHKTCFVRGYIKEDGQYIEVDSDNSYQPLNHVPGGPLWKFEQSGHYLWWDTIYLNLQG